MISAGFEEKKVTFVQASLKVAGRARPRQLQTHAAAIHDWVKAG